jgi:hypothetical protein
VRPPRKLTPFDSLGTNTYVLQMASGQYVYDPTCTAAGCPSCKGFDIGSAFLRLDEQRALAVAKATPWIGASATVHRGRP